MSYSTEFRKLHYSFALKTAFAMRGIHLNITIQENIAVKVGLNKNLSEVISYGISQSFLWQPLFNMEFKANFLVVLTYLII